MRRLLFIFSLLLTSSLAIGQTQEQEPNDGNGEVRYISDDLYTYLHAGPGRNYRILGSVLAGTRVTQLQIDTESNFVEIIDDKQRTGWVDATFITNRSSIRETLPDLEEQLKTTAASLTAKRQEGELLNQQIADLTTRNEQLNKELNDLQQENAAIQERLNNQDQSALVEWFTRGGIVALGGIIIGVIIAYLPKKRRRNDQWM